jgi:hypothetical protein
MCQKCRNALTPEKKLGLTRCKFEESVNMCNLIFDIFYSSRGILNIASLS